MNLVNIFWIFFRAKDLASASKVIKGMFDISSLINIIFNLSQYRVIFGNFIELSSGGLGYKRNFILLILALLITFLTKNTYEKTLKLKINYFMVVHNIFYLILGILLLEIDSTFLYFNF